MNASPAAEPQAAKSPGFSFFPAGMKHTPGEGRDPRVPLEKDLLSREFPTANQVALFLFLASLALYLASMSWTAFPGPPTWLLLTHLDPNTPPTPLDSIWGWLLER